MSQLDKYDTISMPVQIDLLNIDLRLPYPKSKDEKKVSIQKKVLLFGDEHTPMPTAKPKKNEVAVPAFLFALMKEVTESKNKCIDVWIENHIHKKEHHYEPYWVLRNQTFTDFNNHFYHGYLGDVHYLGLANTLNTARNFLANCHAEKKVEKCAYGEKQIRVHDFDTRFNDGINENQFISFFLAICTGLIYSNIGKTSLKVDDNAIAVLMMGTLFLTKYKTFDDYFNSFILPVYEDLKRSFSSYKLENVLGSLFTKSGRIELEKTLREFFNRNTKTFKKVINNMGRKNAMFFYRRLLEYTRYNYTETARIPDVYLYLRMFASFDFSTSKKIERSPCLLGRDDGTVSPKYNIVYAGVYHTSSMKNFLIYYSKAVSRGVDGPDFRLLTKLERMHEKVIEWDLNNPIKYVHTKHIEVYNLSNDSMSSHTPFKNTGEFLHFFLYDQKPVHMGRHLSNFKRIASQKYDREKANAKYLKTKEKPAIVHNVGELLIHYQDNKNKKKNVKPRVDTSKPSVKCKGLRKTKNPKCEEQKGCKWVVRKGCQPIGSSTASRPKVVSEPKKETPANRDCPQGKIVNPKTGRCVNVDGRIGRQILASQRR